MLVGAVLLLLGIVASKASDRLGVPALLFFLVLGMVAGSEGWGGIYFDDAFLAQAVGVAALAIILFAGGLDTEWQAVRPILRPAIGLASAGVILTAFITGWFAHLVLNITLTEGLLLGAVVSSTDAAAVFAVMRSRSVSLKGSLAPLIEFESASNDPMAVLLTVGLIQVITVPQSTALGLGLLFVRQVVLGLLFGFVLGRVAVLLINNIRLGYEGLYPVLSMGVVLFIYASTAVLGGSGFLAIYIAGLIMGNSEMLHRRSLMRFHDGLAWLMQIVMFLTLGLLVFPSRLLPVAGPALLIAIVLMLVSRPIAVFLLMTLSTMNLRERTMVAWVGLRGAVPIVLATFPLLARVGHADIIFNVVFFVVFLSVAVQGPTIPFLARLLHVDAPLRLHNLVPLEIVAPQSLTSRLAEITVSEHSVAAGRRVMDLHLPDGALVVLLRRGQEYVVPNGGTVIEPGAMYVLGDAAEISTVEAIVAGGAAARGEAPRGR